jgi:ATP-dependent Clp protease ATP-binding subunit ClpC
MTSNIGARFIQKRGNVGFQNAGEASREKMEDQVLSQVKQTFAPEFINRLDEIIIFDELADDDLLKIVDLQLAILNERLENRGLRIRINDDARKWLVEKTCADRSYGARPLKRALQKYVEDELSEALIQGDVGEDSEIEIIREGERLAFRPVTEKELEKEFFQKA